METALITSFSADGVGILTEILANFDYTQIETAKNYQEARTLFQHKTFDLYLIHCLEPYHVAVNLAKKWISQPESQVLFVIREGVPQDICDSLEELGVIILEKPLHKKELAKYFKFLAISQVRFRKLQQEKEELAKEILNIKLVNRAKFILISHLNMSESEAHKYIEKEAMNTRNSKVHVAQKILKTYDY